MKINKILRGFLQILVLTGSSIFTSKTVGAEGRKNTDDGKSINDRINSVREHLRNSKGDIKLISESAANSNDMKTAPNDQIWINIAPWGDWNKLWNDWSNWNNWANFHRDDHDRGHDRGHDRDHGHR